MQEKTIEIIAPEGYEVDKEKSSFEKIVFRALPDKGLPRSWNELRDISGYYVGALCDIRPIKAETQHIIRNLFPSKEEAEASIALAQLCQLRDRYNGGWKPDWTDVRSTKFCISFSGNGPIRVSATFDQYVLCFKSIELRDKFMENLSDLIEKAKPLLG